MNKQRLAILITAAVGALSTFMPWVTAGPVSIAGNQIDYGLGWISFGLFAVALVLCLLDDKQKKLSGPLLMGAIITPSLAALLGIGTIWKSYAGKREAIKGAKDAIDGTFFEGLGGEMIDAVDKSIGIGFGLYFVVLAGILIPLFALLIKDKDEASSTTGNDLGSILLSTKAFIVYFSTLLILPFILILLRNNSSEGLEYTYIIFSIVACSLLPIKISQSKSFTRLNSLFKLNTVIWILILIWKAILPEISFFTTYALNGLYYSFTEYYSFFFVILGGFALTADVFEKGGNKIDSLRRLSLLFNYKFLISIIFVSLVGITTYKFFTVHILSYEEMETFNSKNDTFSGTWYYLNKDTTDVEFVNFNYNTERQGESGEVKVDYSAQIIENGAFQVKNYTPTTSIILDYTQQISFPILFDDVIQIDEANEKELKVKIQLSNGTSKNLIFTRDSKKLYELVRARENRQYASQSFEFEENQFDAVEKSFVVNSEKTYFHNGPSASQRRKAYLVKGDIGTFNAEVDGFVFIRFTNSRGAVSEGWVQLSDLEVSGISVTKKIPSIYPNASERLLTASDLVGMDSWDLIIIRNEIYARHGYIFKSQKLKDYFSKQSWYVPRYDNVESKLSVIEQKNVMFIKSFE